jgi:Fe-S-cluster-containing hydrogenase component 2
MIRRIIHIDTERCIGCGACAKACHEGAIEMIDGKARLTREDYCDGLGDCLPVCPVNAIWFEEREAPAYDEAAVLRAKAEKEAAGCPGSRIKVLRREVSAVGQGQAYSRLSQWPCQLKLVPINAPYLA